jgi:hypothetical protein
MQSKSPNTVNKVVEEVPSVGCTMGERRGHCPYCPTQFFTCSHFPSQKFHANPYTVQSAWQATLLSITSPRMSHLMCFSKDVAPDANTLYHILKIFQLYIFVFVQVVEGMLQVGCPSCSPQS